MPSVKRDNSYIFLDPDKFKIERTIEKFRFSTKHTHTSASAHTHTIKFFSWKNIQILGCLGQSRQRRQRQRQGNSYLGHNSVQRSCVPHEYSRAHSAPQCVLMLSFFVKSIKSTREDISIPYFILRYFVPS